MALEQRFQTNNNVKKDYVNCMKEYITLGHMEITQRSISETNCYYLSHHAVRIENNTSTKIRVIFDVSAKMDTNLSLNNILLKGPCIKEELVSIISRFLIHNYVITADIKKMYRQIQVNKDQRDNHRIMWREDTR